MTKFLIAAAAIVVLAAGGAGYFLFFRGPSREEYVAQADPICKANDEKLGAVAPPGDLVQLKDAASKLAANSNDTGTRLGKLELPRGDDTKLATEITKLIRESGTKAQALADAASKEDLPAIEKTAAESKTAFKSADERARGFTMVHCGKGGAAGAETIAAASPALLKKNFITRSDAICARGNDELEKLPELADTATFEEVIADFNKVLGIYDRVFNEVRSLPIAAADKAAFDDFMSSFQAMRDKLAQTPDIIRSGSQARADAFEKEITPLGESATKKAETFGFVDCRKLIES